MAFIVLLGAFAGSGRWLGAETTSAPAADSAGPQAETLTVAVSELPAPGSLAATRVARLAQAANDTDAGEEEREAEEVDPPGEAGPGESPWQARLTRVEVGTENGEPLVRLTATGRLEGSLRYLSNPDRLLLKIPHVLLVWKPPRLTVNRDPLRGIRAAQHGAETWVVLDLTRPARWSRESDARGMILRPEGAPQAGEMPVPAAATSEPAASEPPGGVRYQVLDVTAEDEGSKTRLTITTDGPVRYQVERDRTGRRLSLWIYGASLRWSGAVSGLPSGAVQGVSARQTNRAGESAVLLEVATSPATPYLVYKEQNQVVIEVDHPGTVTQRAPSRGSLRTRISVDFQSADLVSVLRALSQDVGFDLVLTPGAQNLSGAQSEVTISIKDQPFGAVLDLILRPRGLAYEISGNTLRVGLPAEFPTETRVFNLKNLDVKNSNLKESLESSFTEGSRSKVVQDDFSNRVIVTAIPSDLFKAEEVIRSLDVQPRLVSRTFSLNYAQAGKIAPLLKSMLSSVASLEVDERNNALIAHDIPGNMLRLAGMIRSLDTKSKQVMIEAWIAEISLNNQQELGVNWNVHSQDARIDPQFTAVGSPAPVDSAGTLTVGTVQKGVNVSATLSALESKGDANMLSNPRIATLDNQSATLSASQNIPYTTNIIDNAVVKPVIQYADLPITLTVMPHITQNDQVLLNPMTLTVTSIVKPGSPPETTTRSATTQMMVKNGETIAIGGLIRDIESLKESKIPLLGDIPLLGFLFRSTVTSKDKLELVVFLTPHILE